MKWLSISAVPIAVAAFDWDPELLEMLLWVLVTLAVAIIEYRRHIRAAEIEAGATGASEGRRGGRR